MKNALSLLLVVAIGTGLAAADDVDQLAFGALAGQVSSAADPLSYSKVYAYHLSGQGLSKVVTDEQGNFRFNQLQAGLYKIIAFKDGFVPAIALLTRSTSEAYQFLNMELVEEDAESGDGKTGFWAVREKIPSDVLRDIEISEAAKRQLAEASFTSSLIAPYQVEARMQAIAGMDENLELGSASMAGGRVGVEGTVADFVVALSGELVALQSAPGTSTTTDPTGRAQTLSVRVQTPGATGVQVSTLNNYIDRPANANLPVNHVGLERHRLSWSQEFGERSHSDFSAEYASQDNLFRQAAIDPFGIPDASTSWRVEGSYFTSPTRRSTVQTGFKYREREAIYEIYKRRALNRLEVIPDQRVDVFGLGGLQLNPGILVEAGIYSTLHDGSLSLAPSAGVVFRLSENWRASASGSVRVHDEEVDRLRPEFSAVLFGQDDVCRTVEEYCYQMGLARRKGEDQEMSVGVVHRRYAETLHLYFNDDFFSRLESLYLVSGDKLPEIHFAATRRLTPRVLAHLSSNLAAGGGGIVYATDRSSYENEVRYLVTSLDTQFEQTSTGVFLAFHHLDQQLNPVKVTRRGKPTGATEMGLDRLQVMLTQDLDILHALASDWAVHLNMELSRGTAPQTESLFDDEDLRKRVMGGVTVSF